MNVLESAAWIAGQSRHVHVARGLQLENAARRVLDRMKQKSYDVKAWKQHPLHPKDLSPSTVDWLVLV